MPGTSWVHLVKCARRACSGHTFTGLRPLRLWPCELPEFVFLFPIENDFCVLVEGTYHEGHTSCPCRWVALSSCLPAKHFQQSGLGGRSLRQNYSSFLCPCHLPPLPTGRVPVLRHRDRDPIVFLQPRLPGASLLRPPVVVWWASRCGASQLLQRAPALQS